MNYFTKYRLIMGLTLVVLSITILSCSREANGEESGIAVIDFANLQPERDIDLSEIADIEYVKVETNDSCLLNSHRTHFTSVSDSLIIFSSPSAKSSYIFDRQGNYLRTFNRQGGGPEEYEFLVHPTVNFESHEITSTVTYGERIMAYDLCGQLKRALDVKPDYIPDVVYDFNVDYLVAHDITNLTMQPLENNDDFYRYFLINKRTGETIKIPIAEEHPIGNRARILVNSDPNNLQSITVNISSIPMLKTGDRVIIGDYAKDTIYTVSQDMTVAPLAIIRNVDRSGVYAPTIVATDFATDRYLFLTKYRIDHVDTNGATVSDDNTILYDFKTGEAYPFFIQQPYLKKERKFSPYSLGDAITDNCFFSWLDMGRLMEELENDNLTEPLKSMVEQSDPEDNPILMIVKFKE